MARIKTFANGGSLLPTDLNAIQDDYENAFASYRNLLGPGGKLDAVAAGTYVATESGLVTAAGATAGNGIIYLDDADFPAGARAVKVRVRLVYAVNATGPGVTFTAGLYPVTAAAGAAATVSLTLGTVVAGSTAAIASPAAGARNKVDSTVITIPADGVHVLAVVVSGAMAAGSAIALRPQLQLAQV